MVEQPRLYGLPEDQRQLVLSSYEHNLKVAGDENDYHPSREFKQEAFPKQPDLRRLFEFETQDGRIWYIQRIMPGEEQFVMRTENKGIHLDVWDKNVIVRLPRGEQ